MDNMTIARVAYEVNRAYCQALGDESASDWSHTPLQQRDSVFNGVVFLRHNCPEATPEESHAAWIKAKESDGWTYHAEKDVEKKQHPCMLPFDKLPREQQAKDFIFQGVVRALIG